jgi:hypothetical protein
VIQQHNQSAHGYADDHQIYQGVTPLSLADERLSLEQCANDVKNWMSKMRLKMNDGKTEYMVIGTPQQLAKCDITQITVGESTN